eukprot:764577-Hanusia_phi.AAC.1
MSRTGAAGAAGEEETGEGSEDYVQGHGDRGDEKVERDEEDTIARERNRRGGRRRARERRGIKKKSTRGGMV